MTSYSFAVSRFSVGRVSSSTNSRIHSSFKNEIHTSKSLLNLQTGPGYPVLPMSLLEPNNRRQDNFKSMSLLILDDDRKLNNLWDFWLADEIFRTYGSILYTTQNSTLKKQKLRIIFCLSEPIYDFKLAKDVLAALHNFYSFTDPAMKSPNWISSGSVNSYKSLSQHLEIPLGFVTDIWLPPYLAKEREKQNKKDKALRERTKSNEIITSQMTDVELATNYRRFIISRLNGIFNTVSTTQPGKRNSLILWAGRIVGNMLVSEWVVGHLDQFTDIENRIVSAANFNGYLAEHSDTLRTFQSGLTMGSPEPPPEIKPPKVKQKKIKNIDRLLEAMKAKEGSFRTSRGWADTLELNPKTSHRLLKQMTDNGIIKRSIENSKMAASKNNPYTYAYTI